MFACMVNGNRTRETFKTREEAETRAEQIRIAKRNEGTAAFSLSPDQRAEASKCFADLHPHDVSLTEVVNHYIDHVLAYRYAPTFNIVGERKQTDFKIDTGRKTMTETFEIHVRNQKSESVTVFV